MFNQDDVAQLRQKVDVIKTKAQVEGIKEDEAKLCESIEERWDQSRLRVLEKKAEIERVVIIPEDERTRRKWSMKLPWRPNVENRRKVETRAVEEYGASAEATGDEHHYSTT